MRFLYPLVFFFLVACSENNKRDNYKEFPCKNITSIWSKDSTDNFLALINSNHLYYLKHSDINYLDKNLDNWDRIDSNILDTLLIISHRKGCNSKKNQCLNIEKHILWKNKIIKFEGTSSGYFANINFKYDKQDRIVKYISSNIVYKFFYFEDILKEVVKFEKDKDNEIAVEKFNFIYL